MSAKVNPRNKHRKKSDPAAAGPAPRRPCTSPTSSTKNHAEALRTSKQRYSELKQELQHVGFLCVGSLQTRYLTCGNPGCRCHQDPDKRHGPYHYWTRKVKGRTVTVLLTEQQVPLYREWIENNRRLEKLVQEMRLISAQMLSVEADALR
jgi:hypothetical protein